MSKKLVACCIVGVLSGCNWDFELAPRPVGTAETSCDDLGSLLLCDGFEDGELDGWNLGTIAPANLGVALSTSEAFLGRYSVRGEREAMATAAFMEGPFESHRSGTLHLRAHFLVAAHEKPADTDLVKLFSPDGTQSLSITRAPDGTLGFWASSAVQASTLSPPTGEWFCLRWSIEYGTSASVELRVDDEATSWQDLDTTLTGGIGIVTVPVPLSTPIAGRVEVFVDEIAIGTEPIACVE